MFLIKFHANIFTRLKFILKDQNPIVNCELFLFEQVAQRWELSHLSKRQWTPLVSKTSILTWCISVFQLPNLWKSGLNWLNNEIERKQLCCTTLCAFRCLKNVHRPSNISVRNNLFQKNNNHISEIDVLLCLLPSEFLC